MRTPLTAVSASAAAVLTLSACLGGSSGDGGGAVTLSFGHVLAEA